ncbi:serine/threonine-protein kinase Nek8 isoform X3 [Stegostoma tigrinum]|uniref:serine/threonine-protein kinase Nek8 isoform X3 n=1 Tax=Stegostoma tigrinum TaxID=3053191 RepID=UPI00202AD26C|nr:serine/threonine-protein kinase Nek8 isoform X3 [Stegostoma tigrinum]
MEKYQKMKVVGRGAFGIVHLCLRKADQKLVILKQIPVDQMTKDERLAAQNECQVLKLLNHPNIIEYYENFLEDKALMIAMEYAPGGTLADYIQKRNSLLDEDTILHFFVQILLALHHVHNKLILHRDLKTQNILLDKYQMIVKIGDFGISKILSSKSKAYTVVGTPCYISPELCEGKPYNQKSDIWALGCVLYELASLKRAFEAANLPALVLKIMSGTFAPISDQYSPELRQLILSMLSLDPSKRPQLSEIMAQPICIRALLNLYTDIGSVRMRRIEKPLSTVAPASHRRTGGRVSSAKSRAGGFLINSTKSGIPLPLSTVYTWGSGIISPLRLPMLNTEVVQVSAGRTQKAGVTRSGRLIMWEPKIVEALLGYEIAQVSCGASHVLVVTNDREVFSWGRGDNGRLGLESQESHNSPQQVCGPAEHEAQKVLCGIDCSMILTTRNHILACGSNRFNKLGLDKLTAAEDSHASNQVEEVHVFTPVQSFPLNEGNIVHVDVGTAHSAAITETGECYTFGSNQHGQLGTNKRHNNRLPYLVSNLCGVKVTMVACGDAFTVAVGAEGEIYTWGKGARGRLGRKEEDTGIPKQVHLDESNPYFVTSVACCHGNTLLAVKPLGDEAIPR